MSVPAAPLSGRWNWAGDLLAKCFDRARLLLPEHGVRIEALECHQEIVRLHRVGVELEPAALAVDEGKGVVAFEADGRLRQEFLVGPDSGPVPRYEASHLLPIGESDDLPYERLGVRCHQRSEDAARHRVPVREPEHFLRRDADHLHPRHGVWVYEGRHGQRLALDSAERQAPIGLGTGLARVLVGLAGQRATIISAMEKALSPGPGPGDDEQEGAVEGVLERLTASSQDDDAWAEHADRLCRLAEEDPAVVAQVADKVIRRGAPMRPAGVHALGRAAEFADEPLLNRIEQLLLALSRTEVDRGVVGELAGALNRVWARSDDETFVVQCEHAGSDNLALRLAAAKHLALATPVPLPGFLTPTLRRLADDNDSEVRRWAEHGLSYEHGWPHEAPEA